MDLVKSPCMGCSDRCPSPNCHTTCTKFKDWQKYREPVHKAKLEINAYADYVHHKNVAQHIKQNNQGWV